MHHSLNKYLACHVLDRALYAGLTALRIDETNLEHDELVCTRGGLVVDVQSGRYADLVWKVQDSLKHVSESAFRCAGKEMRRVSTPAQSPRSASDKRLTTRAKDSSRSVASNPPWMTPSCPHSALPTWMKIQFSFASSSMYRRRCGGRGRTDPNSPSSRCLLFGIHRDSRCTSGLRRDDQRRPERGGRPLEELPGNMVRSFCTTRLYLPRGNEL